MEFRSFVMNGEPFDAASQDSVHYAPL